MSKIPMINRELSWLAFNDRVLQEANDPIVPLIERIRFLGIYSSNLDEFYRVRVAALKRLIALNKKKMEGYKFSPKKLLDEINQITIQQQKKFEIAYQRILKELAKKNVFHIDETQLNLEQQKEIRNYYEFQVKHEIVPIILNKKNKFPQIRDKAIYLAVKITTAKNDEHYALIEVTNKVSRFKLLEEKNTRKVILLDDIIRFNLSRIFSIFPHKKIEAYTFKITRDAELDFDDDINSTLLEKMEKSIKKRKSGNPVRFVYDENMPKDLLQLITKSLGLKLGENTIAGGRYHNFKDFVKFPDFGVPEMVYRVIPPLDHPQLQNTDNIIREVLKNDILLHYPYQKFDYIIDLLREAAIDPKVTEIKINFYRVAGNSKVMSTLINAVNNGKKVTVVIELLARFDEENNIYWANKLKDSGAKIIFGLPNLKVHSKLLLITRVKDGKQQHIVHVGTGNFNEDTAKIYSDFSLLTSNKDIATDVNKVFELFENSISRRVFKELFVSPLNTRRRYVELINDEIKAAKKKHRAEILLKLNNLTDEKMIEKLYEASQAGVKITLLIRGVCCLLPGVKGLSENIQAYALVDRFLEHSRVAIFYNKGKELYFISSADWMERNLDRRIEVTTPIYDKNHQKIIREVLDIQLGDNLKTRIIDRFQKNDYMHNDKPKYRSQIATYEYFQNKLKMLEG
ncbi:MAG: polyphosphate kinase 1 [Bacteroidia bacterium]